MLGILSTIADVITSLINFIVNTITATISVISNIPTFINYLVSSFAYLPDVVLPFCVASLSLMVVLFMINRN